MNLPAAVANINKQTLTYAPAVLAGVQVAETTGASGSTKLQAVVNGVLAASQIAEAVPSPTVAGIAALVNLFVSIFNSTGVFTHSTSTSTSSAATIPVTFAPRPTAVVEPAAIDPANTGAPVAAGN